MIIGGVDFPKALLAAQRTGELAVFAGAGVSMPAPSNYPNFKDLANRVAVAAGKLTAEPEEPLDHFLGRLADTGVQVHEQVSRMLNDPASRPNSLHFDLLRLFRSSNFIRVVTTNFDSHFTNAERVVFTNELPCELHSAPALPLGHSFSGIVALHGAVGRLPERKSHFANCSVTRFQQKDMRFTRE